MDFMSSNPSLAEITRQFLVDYKDLELKKKKRLREFLESVQTFGSDEEISELDTLLQSLQ